MGMFEGSGQAESDFFHSAANELFSGAGNVPGQIQFLGENICGSTGEKGERHAMAVLVGGEAVDDFIECAAAAASDDQAAAFGGGVPGDFRGVPGASGFCEFGIDTAGSENVACGVERAEAPLAS